MMKAIVQTEFGGPDVLHFATVPTPELRPLDILVKVKAVSVNPVDYKVRSGGPAGTAVPDAPRIIGWDGAGMVEAVGNQASRFAVGDEVYFAGDITRAGSYAQYVAIDERIVGHKPKTLSFEEAAALPLTTLTAWEAFFESMDAQRGEGEMPRVALIVGGAGGVGSIAIQIAKQAAGLYVVATASRPESTEFCTKMGAGAVINHRQELAPQFEELGIARADYILSCAPLNNFSQLVAVLNPLGKICSILGGDATTSLDVSGLFAIRGTLSFELMFTRPRLGIAPEKQGRILDRAADLLDLGTFVTTMTQSLSWEQVQQAHAAIETGHTTGKIVMTVENP